MVSTGPKRKRTEATHRDEVSKKLHKRHHSGLKVSSPRTSSFSGADTSLADPTNADTDTTSKVNLVVASISPSEEILSEGDGPEDILEDESKDKDDGDDDEDASSGGRNLGQDPSDEEKYLHQDREQEEPKPDDEESRASRLTSLAKTKARFEKSSLESDAESAASSESSTEWAFDAVSDSDSEPHPDSKKKEIFKADDPNAFASSMAGILGYKLTRTQRANPILARSADAKEADETLLDQKLEKKAKAEMKREKAAKGDGNVDPAEIFKEIQGEGPSNMAGPTFGISGVKGMGSLSAHQQQEKALRKTAQRGVVKMFNAFARVREKAVEAQGMPGSKAKRQQKATEMTKEGWLEYVGHGGKGKATGAKNLVEAG